MKDGVRRASLIVSHLDPETSRRLTRWMSEEGRSRLVPLNPSTSDSFDALRALSLEPLFLEVWSEDVRVHIQSLPDPPLDFDDAQSLETEGLRALLESVDERTLDLALLTTTDSFRSVVYETLAPRSAIRVKRAWEERTPVNLAEIDRAQRTLVAGMHQALVDGTARLKPDWREARERRCIDWTRGVFRSLAVQVPKRFAALLEYWMAAD